MCGGGARASTSNEHGAAARREGVRRHGFPIKCQLRRHERQSWAVVQTPVERVRAAHGGTWQVDARQLAALLAHLGGPEPLVGIACLALYQLAAVTTAGSHAHAQVRRPRAAQMRAGGQAHAVTLGRTRDVGTQRSILWPPVCAADWPSLTMRTPLHLHPSRR